jgi:hypothetical protein
MTYLHKEPKPSVPEEGSEDRLDLCIHCGIHNKKHGVCDPENVLGIEAVSIEGGLDTEGNVILKAVFIIPLKDIP